MSELLPRKRAVDLLGAKQEPLDPETLAKSGAIVSEVRRGGDAALRQQAKSLGDIQPGAPLLLGPEVLEAALRDLDAASRGVLERTAERIRRFAEAQRDCLRPLDVAVDGGRAGHELVPIERAGCYAPGGRYPLPSSVLMTAIPARVAGVSDVTVASPRPAPITLAAAAVAGADRLLAVGGAQAIGALAYGTESLPAVDFLCGPGNRWVTAAKQLVFGSVGVDMLAGPSELLVLADAGADPARVAADLLGQAEHDPDARPLLVSWSAPLLQAVESELRAQLPSLPTAETARAALANGAAVACSGAEEALALVNRLAPEHLEIHAADPRSLARGVQHAGALFLGGDSAEAFGDYGLGPNHALPTVGGARARGGLSVLDFLRVRTWIELDDPGAAADDVASLARLENLEAHARSAEARGSYSEPKP